MNTEQTVLQKLRSNDSSQTVAFPFHITNRNAPLCGRALTDNTVVTGMRIRLDGVREETDCEELLQFLQNSAAIRCVELILGNREGRTNVADRFLVAAFRNPAIKKLLVVCTNIHPDAADQVTAAARQNVTLEGLFLLEVDDQCLIPILHGLRSHPNLKRLRIKRISGFHPVQPNLATVIEQCLSSMTELKKLELEIRDLTLQNFGPIARGMHRCETLNWLSLSGTLNEEATSLFEGLFRTGASLMTLDLSYFTRFSKPAGVVLANVLRQNGSSLRALRVDGQFFGQNVGQDDFAAFTEALEETSTLRNLCFAQHDISQQMCQTLVRSIPKTNLKFIQFRVAAATNNSQSYRSRKAEFMQAFQSNLSLLQVNVQAEFLNRREQDKLRRWMSRNVAIQRSLRKRLHTPFLPHIFARALECDKGPGWVYQMLEIAGDQVGRPEVREDAANNEEEGEGVPVAGSGRRKRRRDEV